MTELEELNKESKKLREAFRIEYSLIREQFNSQMKDLDDLKKRFHDLSLKIDSILEFANKLTEDLK